MNASPLCSIRGLVLPPPRPFHELLRCARARRRRVHLAIRYLVITAFVAVAGFGTNPAVAEDSIWESLRALFSKKSKYPVYNSRTVAHTYGTMAPQFFWLNDYEVLFVPMQI